MVYGFKIEHQCNRLCEAAKVLHNKYYVLCVRDDTHVCLKLKKGNQCLYQYKPCVCTVGVISAIVTVHHHCYQTLQLRQRLVRLITRYLRQRQSHQDTKAILDRNTA